MSGRLSLNLKDKGCWGGVGLEGKGKLRRRKRERKVSKNQKKGVAMA